jgi:hypothetical protein
VGWGGHEWQPLSAAGGIKAVTPVIYKKDGCFAFVLLAIGRRAFPVVLQGPAGVRWSPFLRVGDPVRFVGLKEAKFEGGGGLVFHALLLASDKARVEKGWRAAGFWRGGEEVLQGKLTVQGEPTGGEAEGGGAGLDASSVLMDVDAVIRGTGVSMGGSCMH